MNVGLRLFKDTLYIYTYKESWSDVKDAGRAELTFEFCVHTTLPQENQEQQECSHGLCNITISRYGVSYVVRFMLVFA
jgi:hypothetical protein